VSESHTRYEGAGANPKYRSFEPPEHPPMRDARVHPRDVRLGNEMDQDQMAAGDSLAVRLRRSAARR
jgi:hypothetical protein